MTEKQLQNAIMQKWATDPRIRLWRQNVGLAIPETEWGKLLWLISKKGVRAALNFKASKIKYGLNGQADLSGVIAPNGLKLEIEVKGPKGRQSQEQINWQNQMEKMGAIYILAYSMNDVDKVLGGILDEQKESS